MPIEIHAQRPCGKQSYDFDCKGIITRVKLYQRLRLGLSGPTFSYVGTIHDQEISALNVKDIVVRNMTDNDPDVPTLYLRRGANAMQGLISSTKRKRNKIPLTFRNLNINIVVGPGMESCGAGKNG